MLATVPQSVDKGATIIMVTGTFVLAVWAMARLELVVHGVEGQIAATSLLSILGGALRILSELDAAISREAKGTLDWTVANLATGSLIVALESESRSISRNVGAEVTRSFVVSLEIIERDGVTPPYLTEKGMQAARTVLKLIGRGGVSGIEATDLSERVSVSARAAANIDQLVTPRTRMIGSIEGRIETISIRGRPRVIAYQMRTGKAVTCVFKRDDEARMIAEAARVLGQRVNVSGTVVSNGVGEPIRIEAEQIRVFRSESELPTIAELAGSDPDYTGGLTSEEYLRNVRVG